MTTIPPAVPHRDVVTLTLNQLKSESVRLEREAALIASRLSAVRDRISRIVTAHRANHPRRKRYGEGTRARRPKCSAQGCVNNAQKGGLCERHGEYVGRRCRHPGCTRHMQRSSGFCFRHGAQAKLCAEPGCTNKVQRLGRCYKHGAREGVVRCTVRGCRNVAWGEGGVCKKHAGLYDEIKVPEDAPLEVPAEEEEVDETKCHMPGCRNKARVGGGMCKKHGGTGPMVHRVGAASGGENPPEEDPREGSERDEGGTEGGRGPDDDRNMQIREFLLWKRGQGGFDDPPGGDARWGNKADTAGKNDDAAAAAGEDDPDGSVRFDNPERDGGRPTTADPPNSDGPPGVPGEGAGRGDDASLIGEDVPDGGVQDEPGRNEGGATARPLPNYGSVDI